MKEGTKSNLITLAIMAPAMAMAAAIGVYTDWSIASLAVWLATP